MLTTFQVIVLMMIGFALMGVALFIKKMTLSKKITYISFFLMGLSATLLLSIPFLDKIIVSNTYLNIMYLINMIVGLVILIFAFIIFRKTKSQRIRISAILLMIIGGLLSGAAIVNLFVV